MENNINLPPFYVGQKVVALVTHSIGEYKKGQTYVVSHIRKGRCNCGDKWLISIGIPNENPPYSSCITCGANNSSYKEYLFNAKNFAPIQEQEFKQVTYTKVLEEVPCCEN